MMCTRRHRVGVAATARPRPSADGRGWFPLYDPTEAAARFLARLEALRTELAPAGPIEALIVARLLEAILRLRDCARLRPRGLPDLAWLRAEAHADRLFWRALRELIAARKRRAASAGDDEPVPEPGPAAEVEPLPPIVLDPEPVDWRERLVLDPTCSPYWPVIRRTNVTAEQVAAKLETWPVRDILQCYPDITVDDVRACRDCDAEGQCGPWNPDDCPTPPPSPSGPR